MKKRLCLTLIVLLFLTCLACLPVKETDKGLRLYVFDAGNADAMLLCGESVAVLFDTGLKSGAESLCVRMKEIGIEKLDLIVISHFDKDHIGGVEQILADFEVGQICMPAYEPKGKLYAAMMTAIKDSGTPYTQIEDADFKFSEEEISLSFIPSTVEYGGKDGDDNAQSLICGVSYGDARLLFMGDANGKWLQALCYGSYNLTCNLLKIPHHGVWDDNLLALLTFTLPEFAIVNDSQKHPADAATAALLDTFGVKVWRTRDGECLFVIKRDGTIEMNPKDNSDKQ